MKQFIKDLWNQPLTNREYVLLAAFVITGVPLIALISVI